MIKNGETVALTDQKVQINQASEEAGRKDRKRVLNRAREARREFGPLRTSTDGYGILTPLASVKRWQDDHEVSDLRRPPRACLERTADPPRNVSKPAG